MANVSSKTMRRGYHSSRWYQTYDMILIFVSIVETFLDILLMLEWNNKTHLFQFYFTLVMLFIMHCCYVIWFVWILCNFYYIYKKILLFVFLILLFPLPIFFVPLLFYIASNWTNRCFINKMLFKILKTDLEQQCWLNETNRRNYGIGNDVMLLQPSELPINRWSKDKLIKLKEYQILILVQTIPQV